MNHSCWKLGHSSNWFQPSMSFEGWVKTLIVCENRSSGNKSVICVSTLLRSTPQKIIEVDYEFTLFSFVICDLFVPLSFWGDQAVVLWISCYPAISFIFVCWVLSQHCWQIDIRNTNLAINQQLHCLSTLPETNKRIKWEFTQLFQYIHSIYRKVSISSSIKLMTLTN